jgi:hypothetical protein
MVNGLTSRIRSFLLALSAKTNTERLSRSSAPHGTYQTKKPPWYQVPSSRRVLRHVRRAQRLRPPMAFLFSILLRVHLDAMKGNKS